MKRFLPDRKFIGAIICLLLVALFFIPPPAWERQAPLAVGGILDLSEWDFSTDVTVPLNGEWEFYWNQLLTPADFAGGGSVAPELTGYVSVPHQWRGSVNGTELQKKGCATYRILVKVRPSDSPFGLKTGIIRIQSNLFVNGTLLGGSGRPAAPANDEPPENVPYTAYFSMKGDTVEIILPVSDTIFNGGIILPVYFGSQAAVQTFDRKIMIFETFAAACLFCGGVFNIVIYLVRRRDSSLLYFGLVCLFLFIAYITLGQKILNQLVPGLLYTTTYKIRALCVYASTVLMALFLRRVAAGLLPGWLLGGIVVLFGGYALAGLVLAPAVHILGQAAFVLLTAAVYLVFILRLCRLFYLGRPGSLSRTELILLILALVVVVLDFLVYVLNLRLLPYLVLNNRIAGDICMVLFVVSISYMLSLRFANAYTTIENLSIRLTEQNALKDTFLANTSHEFRTPLHGIIHMTEAVLEHSAGSMAPQQQEKLSLVVTIARRLSVLVTDILDFEKIKNNELSLSLQPVEPRAAVATVLEVLRHIAQGNPVNMVNRVPLGLPPVKADENRLRQILYNLIGNALKFTVSGEVAVSAAIQGDMLHITVTDTGIGIPPDKYEEIFLSFEQVSAGRAEQYGGTGLGLAISRQLAERMGGRIWVEWSELGQGSAITFALPLCASGTADPGEPAPPPDREVAAAAKADSEPVIRQGVEYAILAVDDDPINRQIMVNIFARNNCDILTAASGAEALALVSKHTHIDLVLLDVMMHGMTGYEVCRRLRERYSLFELPVLLVTARSSPEDVAAGFAAGANDYIVKPFHADELRARVTTLLSLKKAVQDVIRTEVAFLQSQIKPHFFYNVLNSIVSLCYTDSQKAGRLLTEFSNYLRRSFAIQENQLFTSLENELELVKSYITIEQARFGDRLSVTYDIDQTLLPCQIPPLIIQPLVENSVRHGLMQREEGGHITVTVRRQDSDIVIEVADDGSGIPAGKLAGLLSTGQPAAGVGLTNINRRLLKYYGEALRLTSQEGRGTVATVRIPATCSEFVQKHLS